MFNYFIKNIFPNQIFIYLCYIKITSMKDINLKHLIESRDLCYNEVAVLLFPDNKHPKLALNRVLKGEARLDSAQISRLAAFMKVEISDLYGLPGWKASLGEDGIHVFKNGEFTARLNTTTWTTEVFKNDELLHGTIIHSGCMSLENYIQQIHKFLFNHESDSN